MLFINISYEILYFESLRGSQLKDRYETFIQKSKQSTTFIQTRPAFVR